MYLFFVNLLQAAKVFCAIMFSHQLYQQNLELCDLGIIWYSIVTELCDVVEGNETEEDRGSHEFVVHQ